MPYHLAISIELHGAVSEAMVDPVFANSTAEIPDGDFRLMPPQIAACFFPDGGLTIDRGLANRRNGESAYDVR